MKYFGDTVEAETFEGAQAVLRERIGRNLRTLREMRGLSLTAAADQIGSVTYKTIANYENGETPMSFETAWRIADFYGVTLGALGGRIMYEPALAGEAADEPAAKLAC